MPRPRKRARAATWSSMETPVSRGDHLIERPNALGYRYTRKSPRELKPRISTTALAQIRCFKTLPDPQHALSTKKNLVTEGDCPRPKKRQKCPFMETDDQQSSLGIPRQQGSDRSFKRSFACPYYRRDFRKYHGCSSYVLNRIKDVKLHLTRKHKESGPSFRCNRCHSTFATYANLEAHLTEPPMCDVTPPPLAYDYITVDQERMLRNYQSRGLTPEEQWYKIWEILFPDEEKRPVSVFVGNALQESMPLLRSFWNTKRADVLSRASDGYGNLNLVAETVDTVLELMETEIQADSRIVPSRAVTRCTDWDNYGSTDISDHLERLRNGSSVPSEPPRMKFSRSSCNTVWSNYGSSPPFQTKRWQAWTESLELPGTFELDTCWQRCKIHPEASNSLFRNHMPDDWLPSSTVLDSPASADNLICPSITTSYEVANQGCNASTPNYTQYPLNLFA